MALITDASCFIIHCIHRPWDLALLLDDALRLVEKNIFVLVPPLVEQRLPKFATKLLFVTFKLLAHVQSFYVSFLFIICTFLCQITILSFFKGSRGTVIDQD